MRIEYEVKLKQYNQQVSATFDKWVLHYNGNNLITANDKCYTLKTVPIGFLSALVESINEI